MTIVRKKQVVSPFSNKGRKIASDTTRIFMKMI